MGKTDDTPLGIAVNALDPPAARVKGNSSSLSLFSSIFMPVANFRSLEVVACSAESS